MIIQFFNDSMNWNNQSILTPLIEFMIILFIIMFITYLFVKVRIPNLIIVVYLISIIVCVISIRSYTIPYTPLIQLLALLFSTVIFIYTMFDYNKKRKINKNEV